MSTCPSLLQGLRKAFETDASRTGRERLLLTGAVAAGKGTIDAGYEVEALNR